MKINYRNPFGLAVVLALAALLAGCNLRFGPPAAPTLLPTFTELAPLDTPTLAPSTDTPLPSATSTPTADAIVFATGATAAVRQGTLRAGEIRTFTLSAGQYQPMILIVDSAFHDVHLAVYEPNGHMLLDPANRWTTWQYLLPATETYTIQVIGGSSTENYTLTAKVAARIYLPGGTGTTTVTGSTPNGYVVSYAVTGKAGQTLKVALTAPVNSAVIDVFGLAYWEQLVKVTDHVVSWTGVLPSNQDYIIEIVPNPGQIINYSLKVTVQ